MTFVKEQLTDLKLAYCITIHKSQGSEFDTVILPVARQHKPMLFKNLLYTGLTRAKQKAILIGNRKALQFSIYKKRQGTRRTCLGERLAVILSE